MISILYQQEIIKHLLPQSPYIRFKNNKSTYHLS
nr:MAG TPA: hypothetical protein [Caudoviricetes sp.]